MNTAFTLWPRLENNTAYKLAKLGGTCLTLRLPHPTDFSSLSLTFHTMSTILSKPKQLLAADDTQCQRSYAVTCAGIIVILKTLVPGSLFIITGDGKRKCIEIKVDAASVGPSIRPGDVKATVRTLSVDGVAGWDVDEDDDNVKIEVLPISEKDPKSFQLLPTDIVCPSTHLLKGAKDVSPAGGVSHPAVSEAGPLESVGKKPPVSAEEGGLHNTAQSDPLPSPSSSRAEVSTQSTEDSTPTPLRRLSSSASTRWEPRPLRSSPGFRIDSTSTAPEAPLDRLNPTHTPTISSNSRRVPTSPPAPSPGASGSQPPRASNNGRNTESNSTMPPPPIMATPSPKKRSSAEMVEDSVGNDRSTTHKRVKVVREMSPSRTRSTRSRTNGV
ncbi:hypothetical protein C8R43DRAFT_697236 [Mycena crocata]|nr:hypothetical protein C8R43DRAFT_697236 [Mycena crocata]